MLTELCLLLVLHDWEAMAAGDSTQAAHDEKVIVNRSLDADVVKQTADMFYYSNAAQTQG